jgi:hypothetical protein
MGKYEREFLNSSNKTCRHAIRYVCNACTYFSIRVSLDNIISSQVSCPEQTCQAKLSSDEVRRILFINNDNLLLNKYDTYLANQVFENVDNFIWCAHECGWGHIYERDPIRNLRMTCIQCRQDTCAFHRVKWHEDMTCDQYDKQNLFIDPRTKKWIRKYSKKCPGCHCNIEKIGGCFHMVCKNCSHQFCWYCLVDYTLIGRGGRFQHHVNCRQHPLGRFIPDIRLFSLLRRTVS